MSWLDWAARLARDAQDSLKPSDGLLGVFDQALYADPTQVTPRRYAQDLTRLRLTAPADGQLPSAEIGAALAGTIHGPIIAATMDNGFPASSALRALHSAVQTQLDRLDPGDEALGLTDDARWDRAERNRERHRTTAKALTRANLLAFGQALAQHRIAAGLMTPAAEGAEMPEIKDGTSVRDLGKMIADAQDEMQFAAAWQVVTEGLVKSDYNSAQTFKVLSAAVDEALNRNRPEPQPKANVDLSAAAPAADAATGDARRSSPHGSGGLNPTMGR